MSGAIRPGDIRKLERKLTQYVVEVKKQTRSANEEDADRIFQESQLEVPRKTGALAESGKVDKSDPEKVTISYGGTINPVTGQSTDDYAVKIHEDLNLRHPNGGKAKYLQDPFFRNIENIKKNVTKKVRSIKV